MQHRPVPSMAPQSKVLAAAALAKTPGRVLVVGSDTRMQNVLASLVRRFGYEAILDDGSRAREPVDAILVDARTDSLEALERVTARDWTTPVLAIVSRESHDASDEAVRVGAIVLPMPIEPEDLRNGLAALTT